MAHRPTIIALTLVWISAPASAADVDVFALRNLNPFLHVYGLPSVQPATLAEAGDSDYAVTFTVVNNSEIRDTDTESIVLDGETYLADFTWRRRVHERLEIGIDVPLVKHSPGMLDRFIYDWHDFWGISNSKRGEPHNQLEYFYENEGAVLQQLTSSSFGVGDVQLSAAVPLVAGNGDAARRVTMRFSVKLPTGDSEDLHGSGATDAALGVYAQDSGQLFGRELAYLGFAGILALGDGDILPDQQKSAVPYGGLAATWHATGRFGITAQLQAQGAYMDSGLDELGGSSIQLTVGGIYRWPHQGVALRFALVEDVISDATPDFALYFGVHFTGAR
ncbi:MAG: DUF3187 family protein [Gammaproteobacteria bacterium]